MKKWKNKKGLTLIELLAVMVILAIIFLILTPTILGVVEKARKGSAISSAYGYIEGIENETSLSYLTGNLYENKEYEYDEIGVNVTGDIPTAGSYNLESSKVSQAVFCISGYVITYSDNVAKAGDECDPEDLKRKGSVKLSSSFGKYLYPEYGEVEIIENISGGSLSCSSSDDATATCEINENIMTVRTGTKEGTVTITVTSASTSNYRKAQTVYVATTEEGILSVTASDKTITYDGNPHGIEVTSSGAIIKYKDEEGNYTLDESPTYTKVGTYEIYYQVTKEGYKTVTSFKTLTIEAGTYTLSFDPNGGSVDVASKEVTNGETYGDLPTPTKEGYTFIGWFTENNIQILPNDEVLIISDITLYAHWEPIKYALTITSNDSSLRVSGAGNYIAGTNVTITLTGAFESTTFTYVMPAKNTTITWSNVVNYATTASNRGGGSVANSVAQASYQYNIPESGYYFAELYMDGNVQWYPKNDFAGYYSYLKFGDTLYTSGFGVAGYIETNKSIIGKYVGSSKTYTLTGHFQMKVYKAVVS